MANEHYTHTVILKPIIFEVSIQARPFSLLPSQSNIHFFFFFSRETKSMRACIQHAIGYINIKRTSCALKKILAHHTHTYTRKKRYKEICTRYA